jgi:hypothetical protein
MTLPTMAQIPVPVSTTSENSDVTTEKTQATIEQIEAMTEQVEATPGQASTTPGQVEAAPGQITSTPQDNTTQVQAASAPVQAVSTPQAGTTPIQAASTSVRAGTTPSHTEPTPPDSTSTTSSTPERADKTQEQADDEVAIRLVVARQAHDDLEAMRIRDHNAHALLVLRDALLAERKAFLVAVRKDATEEPDNDPEQNPAVISARANVEKEEAEARKLQAKADLAHIELKETELADAHADLYLIKAYQSAAKVRRIAAQARYDRLLLEFRTSRATAEIIHEQWKAKERAASFSAAQRTPRDGNHPQIPRSRSWQLGDNGGTNPINHVRFDPHTYTKSEPGNTTKPEPGNTTKPGPGNKDGEDERNRDNEESGKRKKILRKASKFFENFMLPGNKSHGTPEELDNQPPDVPPPREGRVSEGGVPPLTDGRVSPRTQEGVPPPREEGDQQSRRPPLRTEQSKVKRTARKFVRALSLS